jgi:sporulation protein YlmC with PRC-barrel domain
MDENHNKGQKKTLFMDDIVGSPILDANGKKLGRVVEIKITPTPPYRVTALLFGAKGWLRRLAVIAPFDQLFGEPAKPSTIEWEAVESFENSRVKLKPGYHPTGEKSRSS